MNVQFLSGIVALCVAMDGVAMSYLFIIMMIGEINRKRHDRNLVSFLVVTFPKTIRVFREYRQTYPEGRLYIYTWITTLLGFIGMLVAAVCLIPSFH